ncbi:MAG: malate dehydrogenase [Legionellales bacterium]|jgi:malic enzyme|nr:malate dehydrogenase [Legionellales bacterium]
MTSSQKTSRALEYHASPRPGKIEIQITKSTNSQDDLALAYSPGVAEPVLEIANNPENAYKYTAKGNLVAVISNGSAILGLGNLGPLASKPVMEGKAALFKKFADIDVFDIEVDAKDNAEFIQTVVNIAPTFGGINLEDIKAPDCFVIEDALKAKLDIPVFHDDQHGTAVSIAAGLINALEIQEKKLEECKICCIGAGAAAIASMNFLVKLGAKIENIYLVDSKGLVNKSRSDINTYKRQFAQDTIKTTQQDAIENADILIGLAGPDIISAKELKSMNDKPIIFTLSNPNPEISYELAKSTRPDGIIATGRSDLPNQINNVLCFPYIFKGALAVKAKTINFAMQKAAAYAIAKIAKQPVPDTLKANYNKDNSWSFGRDYIIPMPLDPRLKDAVTTAVANAAKASL